MDLPLGVAILVAVIGGFGGASGIVALLTLRGTNRQARSAASKTDVEALSLIVDAVQDENKRLRDLVDKLTVEVKHLCDVIGRYRSGVNKLIRQIESNGLTPAWRPDPEDDL